MNVSSRVPRLGLLVLIPCCLAVSFLWAQNASKDADKDHPYERQQWFMRGRTVNGRPGAKELNQAYQQKVQRRTQRARASSTRTTTTDAAQGAQAGGGPVQSITSTAPVNGNVWTPLGPAPAATSADSSQDYGPAVGRITSVVVDQGDPTGNTVYIGGATGGVWRSYNAADSSRSCTSSGSCTAPNVTWTALTDGQVTTVTGAIALQPGGSGPCSSGQAAKCATTILVGTGEANSSADSYYGQGFLLSTDGGTTWTNIPKATVGGTSTDLTGIGFTKIAFSTDNPSVVVAAGASSSVGPNTGSQLSKDNRLGLYYSLDGGNSWAKASPTDPTGAIDAGSATDVLYNPAEHKFYAAMRYHGIYVSSDAVNWTRATGQPAPSSSNTVCSPTLNRSCQFYRGAMTIVPGRDEMYVFVVNSSDGDQGIFQSLDGSSTWTSISTTGIDNCSAPNNDGSGNGCGTDQGSYNLTIAAIPNGTGNGNTDLYAGAVNEYKCSMNSATNAGCLGSPFINLTHVYGCPATGNSNLTLTSAHVHPDEHGIDFAIGVLPKELIFIGNDGGAYRVLDGTTLTSGTCPTAPAQSLWDNLDQNMGSMLQFVSFSQDPSDSTVLLGGTQDNGTPKKDSTSVASTYGFYWGSAHIGDGGYSAINPSNPLEWFTTYANLPIQRCVNTSLTPSSCTDAGFTDDITQAKAGGDNTTFYPVFILDPQSNSQLILGTCRMWRGPSNGTGGSWGTPGTPLSNNFNTGSNVACSSSQGDMVSAIAAGGPPSTSTQNPGVSTAMYAGTEGTPPDSSTGTTGSGGQLFVSLSADTASAGGGCSGTGENCPGNGWQNVTAIGSATCTATAGACNINPSNYNISGVAIDPSDATGKTAFVTIMGFHVKHVLMTTNGGQTWAALDGDPNNGGLPDAPANSVVVHPSIGGQIYVGTDVGVFAWDSTDKVWYEVDQTSSSSLPNVPVTHLEILKTNTASYKLRASTYGRGVWETSIPATKTPDFLVTITNPSLTVYPNTVATYNGTITYLNNYTSAISVSCSGGAPACSGPVTVLPASPSFSINASNATAGAFSFDITATGTDASTTTHSVPVSLNVVDFSLTAPSPSSVSAKNGSAAPPVTFNIVPAGGSLNAQVNLQCTGLSTDVTCSFSPSSPTVQNASVPVTLTINAGPYAIPGTYSIGISGTTADGKLTHSDATPVSLTITANRTFEMSCPNCTAGAFPPLKATQSGSVNISFSGQDGYSGGVNPLTCSVTAATGSNPPTCSVASSVSTVPLNPASVTTPLTLNATSASAGTGTVTITGTATDTSANTTMQTLVLPYSVGDFAVSAPQTIATVPGGSVTLAFTVTSLGGYQGTMNVSCTKPSDPTVSCSVPSTVTLAANGSATVNVNVTTTSTTAAANDTIGLTVTDAPLTHSASGTVSVQDFSFSASPTSVTVKAGAVAGNTTTLTVAPLNGYSGTVKLSCTAGVPSKANCTFSVGSQGTTQGDPATVTLTGSTPVSLIFNTTAATAELGRPPLPRRGTPLFAFYLGLPAIVCGVVSIGNAGKNKRRRWMFLAGLTVALLLVLAACGGGGGGGGGGTVPTPVPGTPAGTYSITVTASATSGSTTIQHTQTVSLTVQ